MTRLDWSSLSVLQTTCIIVPLHDAWTVLTGDVLKLGVHPHESARSLPECMWIHRHHGTSAHVRRKIPNMFNICLLAAAGVHRCPRMCMDSQLVWRAPHVLLADSGRCMQVDIYKLQITKLYLSSMGIMSKLSLKNRLMTTNYRDITQKNTV